MIEAVCSDRYVVAGQLLLVDPASGARRQVDTAGVDVSWSEWRAPGRLFAIGLRGLDTVALEVDSASGDARETWVWAEGCGDFSPFASPIGADDAFAAVVGGGHATHDADQGRGGRGPASGDDRPRRERARCRSAIAARERVTWTAPDGLEIQGFITLPATGTAPTRLIAHVHGGPIWATTDHPVGAWSGALLDRGYAIFQPNPRGSSGRGREFAARVIGDMGGGDARDILSGLDHLVERGLADPERIGVMGGSYGGFMAAWLPTRGRPVPGGRQRLAGHRLVLGAVRQHAGIVGRRLTSAGNRSTCPRHYVRQSPVLAKDLTTPTLLTAGLHDRATPVGQATEFYRALRGRGVPAEVVRYPQEGHGVRNFPALIDFVARTVDWFERFMPPRPIGSVAMTTREALEAMPIDQLHDRTMKVARHRLDVGFLWDLVKALPVAEEVAGDDQRSKVDIMRPLALLNDLVRDTDEGALGEALRPMYVDYLLEHDADWDGSDD